MLNPLDLAFTVTGWVVDRLVPRPRPQQGPGDAAAHPTGGRSNHLRVVPTPPDIFDGEADRHRAQQPTSGRHHTGAEAAAGSIRRRSQSNGKPELRRS